MNKLIFIIVIFCYGCVTSVYDKPASSFARIYAENYQETIDCRGKGIEIKGIKRPYGPIKSVSRKEIYVPQGNYFVFYSQIQQVKLPNDFMDVQCSTKGLLIDHIQNDIESETGKKASISRWPSIKLQVQAGKSYFLSLENGQIVVTST